MSQTESELEKQLREAAERAKRMRDAAKDTSASILADAGAPSPVASAPLGRPTPPLGEGKR